MTPNDRAILLALLAIATKYERLHGPGELNAIDARAIEDARARVAETGR